jgi:uncharacterized RDD family membrane protein YckC
VVQYVIDYVLVGIIPGLAYWLLDRGHGILHGFGWALATLIAIVVYYCYWVVRPHSHDGQTFGMQLLGVRVISKHGGPASSLQLFVRGILLIVDTLFFGLVGLITMLCSRYHQRVGDHLARTLVVRADYVRARGQYAGPGAGQGYGGPDWSEPGQGYGGPGRSEPGQGYGGPDWSQADQGYGGPGRSEPGQGGGGLR